MSRRVEPGHRPVRGSRPDRKYVVGLLPEDPDSLFPEGTHLVAVSSAPGPAGADARPCHPQLPHLGVQPSSSALSGHPPSSQLCTSGR